MAEYPWIFNPEWQLFAEEKSIGKQLREWAVDDCSEDMKNKRVDFLAFARGTNELVIIELKRPGHSVEFNELQRLERYQFELMRSRDNCRRVLVYGGSVNIKSSKWKTMLSSEDFSVFLKKKMLERTKRICFLIGSELGLDLSLKKSCHIISLGRKTWPHLMVRIMLIEQIYRSLEIIKNSSYHK